MKCACGDSTCVSEVGFDSSCGLLVAEGNPGAAAAGIYLSVADAVSLARQLRAFIVSRIEEPLVGSVQQKDTGHEH